MKRTLCMVLVGVVALCPAAFTQSSSDGLVTTTLQKEAKDYWQSQLSFSKKADQVDMDEVAARLGWVLAGHPLPPDARDHCIKQANNPRPDFVGWYRWKQNVTPAKRTLCMGILALDDANRDKKSLEARVTALEWQLRNIQQK